METNYFKEFYTLDVSNHVEKKGKFSYLSWCYAVAELNKFDPEANWEIKRFNGLPFLASECGYFVEVAVTVKGIAKSQIHPVLNNQNKPIEKPTSFDINTSIQRCLVKAIALHGLGLYIYAGEDLPEQEQLTDAELAERFEERKKAILKRLADIKTVDDLNELWRSIHDPALEAALPPDFKKRKTELTKTEIKEAA